MARATVLELGIKLDLCFGKRGGGGEVLWFVSLPRNVQDCLVLGSPGSFPPLVTLHSVPWVSRLLLFAIQGDESRVKTRGGLELCPEGVGWEEVVCTVVAGALQAGHAVMARNLWVWGGEQARAKWGEESTRMRLYREIVCAESTRGLTTCHPAEIAAFLGDCNTLRWFATPPEPYDRDALPIRKKTVEAAIEGNQLEALKVCMGTWPFWLDPSMCLKAEAAGAFEILRFLHFDLSPNPCVPWSRPDPHETDFQLGMYVSRRESERLARRVQLYEMEVAVHFFHKGLQTEATFCPPPPPHPEIRAAVQVFIKTAVNGNSSLSARKFLDKRNFAGFQWLWSLGRGVENLGGVQLKAILNDAANIMGKWALELEKETASTPENYHAQEAKLQSLEEGLLKFDAWVRARSDVVVPPDRRARLALGRIVGKKGRTGPLHELWTAWTRFQSSAVEPSRSADDEKLDALCERLIPATRGVLPRRLRRDLIRSLTSKLTDATSGKIRIPSSVKNLLNTAAAAGPVRTVEVLEGLDVTGIQPTEKECWRVLKKKIPLLKKLPILSKSALFKAFQGWSSLDLTKAIKSAQTGLFFPWTEERGANVLGGPSRSVLASLLLQQQERDPTETVPASWRAAVVEILCQLPTETLFEEMARLRENGLHKWIVSLLSQIEICLYSSEICSGIDVQEEINQGDGEDKNRNIGLVPFLHLLAEGILKRHLRQLPKSSKKSFMDTLFSPKEVGQFLMELQALKQMEMKDFAARYRTHGVPLPLVDYVRATLSALAKQRDSFGMAWLAAWLYKKNRTRGKVFVNPPRAIDLSETHGVSPEKIFLFMRFLPPSIEEIKLDSVAVKGKALPLLQRFFGGGQTGKEEAWQPEGPHDILCSFLTHCLLYCFLAFVFRECLGGKETWMYSYLLWNLVVLCLFGPAPFPPVYAVPSEVFSFVSQCTRGFSLLSFLQGCMIWSGPGGTREDREREGPTLKKFTFAGD
uniref:Uncharacterized protein n=1 Tax=Chromera velia CCMP2878 TaxID=1169474 RepID=A0A0G4G1G7_9ALVE|eukprot:Cvel_4001.t1-p1 / transcript=Cvel_4001.t1 / gene=Cvel_4001 / organism=Chromera_velia_CCMP2878 / gene_product=hypothetical protein / transcript_product=hypothetical protein / location=Cvel_scaffold170:16481-30229(-) / protein_length=980 / sequence_SO=supercontig / SO=protein_coding / is_pseudo=false